MDIKELYERGLKLRREIFGKDAVEQRMRAFGDFGQPLQEIINTYVYGNIWNRPGLSQKERSLVMIGMIAATNRPHELRVHVEGALSNGCSLEELREVLLLVAMYCGIPASNDAHRIVFDVAQEQQKRSSARSTAPGGEN